MTTLTIRIPNDLRRELEKIAAAEEKPISDVVRESIRNHVALGRFRTLRRKVLPFAEAEGLLTDEDIFKALS